MEEPKKVLRAQYLGSMQVSQATGMEVLNDAIDHIVANTPINQWRNVNVAVAPSMISILTPNVSGSINILYSTANRNDNVSVLGRETYHRVSSALSVVPRNWS